MGRVKNFQSRMKGVVDEVKNGVLSFKQMERIYVRLIMGILVRQVEIGVWHDQI